MSFSLETERLRLRPWCGDDLDNLHRLMADPVVMRWLPSDPVEEVEGCRPTLERILGLQEREGWAFWPVVERDGDRFVGDCGLKPLPDTDEIELGYHFVPGVHGRGYAPEAARAVLAHGFEERGLERIVAVAVPENRASWRVMEKVGMRRVEDRVAYGLETVCYALTADEWRALP